MPGYELTEAAEADVAGIAEYTQQRWGKGQVTKYLDAFEARLMGLAQRPKMGRPRGELAPALLSFPFESHVIYYIATETGIVVMRVLHQRQDPRRHIR